MTFTFADCKKNKGIIEVPTLGDQNVMDFMIDVCVTSKKRGQQLFPAADPLTRDDAAVKALTRQIFADAISNLIALWTHIWEKIED